MDDNESFSTTPSSADGIKSLKSQRQQCIPGVVATSAGISNDNATIASPPPSPPGVVVPYWVKIVSGSIGSMVTAFAVTPLEVVKVRQQSQQVTTMPTTSINTNNSKPSNVTLCPRGCGTFVFNNGLGECLLPKSAVPYFGTTACTTTTRTRKLPNLNTTIRTTNSSAMNDGTFQMIRRIFATEGLAGIYAGLAPTLVMGVPNTVLYFVTYEELATRLRNHHQSSFDNHNNIIKSWSPALAGGAARFIASTSTAPLELIRTRQAARIGSDIHANKGMVEEMTYIIRKEGFPALYNGLSPTLWRDVPFSAIYWLGIERMREEWRIYHQRNNHHNHQTITTFQQAYQGLINGSISGMVAAFCTTPLDVIKTRRQTEFIQINTNAVILEEAAVVAAAASSSATAATATAVATFCDHEGAVVYNPSSTTTRGGTTGNSTSAATTITTTRSSQPQQPSKPRGTIHMMKDIFVEEGISGLWKGNQARMFKVAPACAIMISSYEVGKRILSPSEET